MNTHSRFVIENSTSRAIQFQVEPESVRFCLNATERATIRNDFNDEPVTLRFNEMDNGEMIISVWPGDGHTVVEKCGKDVLDRV